MSKALCTFGPRSVQHRIVYDRMAVGKAVQRRSPGRNRARAQDGGASLCSAIHRAGLFAVRVRGHEVAWASTAAGRTTSRENRGKGGTDTVGSPATCRHVGLGADTAVSIGREVVFGHAYAIPAPETAMGGWCGYDNPTNLSVDGVFTRISLGPGAPAPGPSTWRCYGPTR